MATDRLDRVGSMTPLDTGDDRPVVPQIDEFDSFLVCMRKLNTYFVEAVQKPVQFEGFRGSTNLRPLIESLADECQNKAVVHAILALKLHFDALESEDERGLNESRGFACEYVAWRFITHLSGRESIDYLLYELPRTEKTQAPDDEEIAQPTSARERSPLLRRSSSLSGQSDVQGDVQDDLTMNGHEHHEDDEFAASFGALNALEVAAVGGAKKFLSQRVVQRMIESIWKGEIVFWETLSVESVKEAKIYNRKKADPFCRLRVPRYLKTFEALFFLSFLALYYAVLIPIQRVTHDRLHRPGVPPFYIVDRNLQATESQRQKSFHSITTPEVFLFIWIAGFAYDEFGEYRDAGLLLYAADFWSLWDIGIVAIGVAFFVTRIVGLVKGSDEIIGAAFDILALQALLLVPRLCSIFSLNPYFGTLIPCLRAMTVDFIKFLSLVIILHLGFLTTFTLLARDTFTLREMSWILVKVFFGSSYLGFDNAQKISPYLGPPLMLIFITLTNILLITSLISLLSNSLTRILDHAREEYLFIYADYVLQSSTSNRLTYFMPPMNLIPLLLRPLRLCISTEQLRKMRIVLLKITHSPHVAAIAIYEKLHNYWFGEHKNQASSSLGGGPLSKSTKRASYLRYSAYTPRTFVAASLNHASPSQAARGRSTTSLLQRPATRASEQDDLKSLVLRLSSQVEELTAIVAKEQQGKGEVLDNGFD